MKEDDGPWREGEEDEQERRRTEWEYEQDEQREIGESAAPPGGFSLHVMLLLLLLNLALVKTVV